MKELKCPNCGAPINRATMKCEYCGATFEMDGNFVIIQREHPKIIPLTTVMKVEKAYTTLPGFEAHLVDSMAYSLAKQITKYMDVVTQDDPYLDQVAVRGRVRVVPPDVKL